MRRMPGQREDEMRPIFCNYPVWLLGSLIAMSAFPGPAAAQSLENQCRIAVRVEMMGPNCRMIDPANKLYQPGDPCYILGDTRHMLYTEKVVECVARGGPGKRAMR
jgi:hypothetical protein